jgi:hypothetical protein
MKLIDGHVYPAGHKYPDNPAPSNMDEINRILKEPRRSLSPSQFSNKEFREFQQANADVHNENDVTHVEIPIIQGNIKDGKCFGRGVSFGNLDSLIEGAAPGNPDLFYGARPDDLDLRIRNKLGRFIMPSTQKEIPLAPNFFLAAKGPDGSAAVANRQACYHGALGARGMQKLQSYGQSAPVYDQNAYTITSTYHYGTLNMYTTHIAPPAGSGPPEYYMTQCDGFSLTGNLETCRQGFTAFRNAREWTEKKRDQFISDANERARSTGAESLTLESSDRPGPFKDGLAISPSHPVATLSSHHCSELPDIPEEVETSADDLALPSTKRRKVSEETASQAPRRSARIPR